MKVNFKSNYQSILLPIDEQDQFDEKQVQARENKMIEAGLQQQRIDVQKAIADDKLQLAIDRMRQQADLKLTELEVKTRQ